MNLECYFMVILAAILKNMRPLLIFLTWGHWILCVGESIAQNTLFEVSKDNIKHFVVQ